MQKPRHLPFELQYLMPVTHLYLKHLFPDTLEHGSRDEDMTTNLLDPDRA